MNKPYAPNIYAFIQVVASCELQKDKCSEAEHEKIGESKLAEICKRYGFSWLWSSHYGSPLSAVCACLSQKKGKCYSTQSPCFQKWPTVLHKLATNIPPGLIWNCITAVTTCFDCGSNMTITAGRAYSAQI